MKKKLVIFLAFAAIVAIGWLCMEAIFSIRLTGHQSSYTKTVDLGPISNDSIVPKFHQSMDPNKTYHYAIDEKVTLTGRIPFVHATIDTIKYYAAEDN